MMLLLRFSSSWALLNIAGAAAGVTRLLGSSFGLPGVEVSYDYVVIGGGTAGLTIAQRLAEDARTSVAVIEAGSFYEIDNGNISQIPYYSTLYSSPKKTDIQPLIDWGLVTQPQAGLNGRSFHYAQGKCLGGSSARNYLLYQRGTLGSYQKWADTVGDQSYTFKNLLPYFKKSVRFTAPNSAELPPNVTIPYDSNAFSPSGGPLHVSYSNYYEPFSVFSRRALEAVGLKSILGLNSGKLIGFGYAASTIDPKDQTRSSSETSFLRDGIQKPNLIVYHHTEANKIIFDQNKNARAVNLTTSGLSYVLKARKEVIVSTGAFYSPQLLMISGIGPKPTLEELGISVISDLPGVGQNMWDQTLFSITYRVDAPTDSLLQIPANVLKATESYLNNQNGPLTKAPGNFVGWEKLPAASRSSLTAAAVSELSQFPDDWPELEYFPLPSTTVPTNDSANYASFSAVLIAPLSRGNVTIASADVETPPLINPNLLASSTDQQVAIQAFKRLREMARGSGATYGPEFDPGDKVQSDAEILEVIKAGAIAIHHACATCAMGKPDDPRAVVDSNGKVFGTQGLRVVDASAFPFAPPGHIQSTVYALAEKIADDIKAGR